VESVPASNSSSPSLALQQKKSQSRRRHRRRHHDRWKKIRFLGIRVGGRKAGKGGGGGDGGDTEMAHYAMRRTFR